MLELRKYKNINYLELSSRVNNYLLVRYEDIRDHAEEFIEYVAKTFDLDNTKDFFSIDVVHSYRKIRKKYIKGVPYVKKDYFPIPKEQVEFININIDWDVEEKIGFFKKEQVD